MSAGSGAAAPAADDLQRARQLLDDGDAAQAQRLVNAALQARPDDPQALFLGGRIALLGGRIEQARALLDRALEIRPENVEAQLELAALSVRARELDAALDSLTLALHYAPDHAAALCELGNVHRLRGDLDAAIEFFRKAIDRDPTMARAHVELGFVYLTRERFADALEVLERAVELDPTSVNGQNNLGYAYVRLEQYERALEVFSRLCAVTPRTLLWPRLNYANALDHTGHFAESERVYESMLQLEPKNFTARWNRAHHLLGRKEYAQGWRDFGYRMQVDDVWYRRLIPFAPWKGEPLAGKTLLISAEQGLGDQIMFASCLPEVVAAAGQVILECNERLVGLFQRSFPGVRIVSGRQEKSPPWLREVGHPDYHVLAGSLPGFLRNRIEDFPRHQGYLVADPARIAHWRARLAALGPGAKVGLSWRGGTHLTRRTLRSLTLPDLLPMLRMPGLRFVSLQYGECAAELEALRRESGIEVVHWPEAIADYDETAALCASLDLTVSVCTSVIHLNGALGRPVWVMVPAVAEWRYGVSGESMPWYPSVRLVRQAARGAWSDVFGRIAQDLAQRFAA